MKFAMLTEFLAILQLANPQRGPSRNHLILDGHQLLMVKFGIFGFESDDFGIVFGQIG